MEMPFDNYFYTICGHDGCFHFVEPNDVPVMTRGPIPIAAWVHLDNGEKDYDHDASNSGISLRLREWKRICPNLFRMMPDGQIGPNSIMFKSIAGRPDISDKLDQACDEAVNGTYEAIELIREIAEVLR